jgi:hypothetical protein
MELSSLCPLFHSYTASKKLHIWRAPWRGWNSTQVFCYTRAYLPIHGALESLLHSSGSPHRLDWVVLAYICCLGIFHLFKIDTKNEPKPLMRSLIKSNDYIFNHQSMLQNCTKWKGIQPLHHTSECYKPHLADRMYLLLKCQLHDFHLSCQSYWPHHFFEVPCFWQPPWSLRNWQCQTLFAYAGHAK